MPFTDKSLTCIDCSQEFVFTAGEQEFHNSKGFTNEPRRCPTCRRARKGMDPNAAPRPERQLYSVTCASCGKDAKVPFEPTGNRPVYCSDCFKPAPRPSYSGGGGGAYSSGGGGGGYSSGGYSGGGGGGGFGGGRSDNGGGGRGGRSEYGGGGGYSDFGGGFGGEYGGGGGRRGGGRDRDRRDKRW